MTSDADVMIDFSNLRSSEPFGLLFAGSALRTFFFPRQFRGVSAGGVRGGEPAHENLAHIGFFQWIGIPVGKMPGMVPGGSTWIPLTTLTRMQIQKRMLETGKPLGSVIHEECERLAHLLTRSAQRKANEPIAYCLREVIRNVFEHAEIDRCAFCAERWGDSTVELAVVDQGRGIRSSLAETVPLESDEDALRTAIRAGVSSKLSSDPDDPWGNSGFGLFVLSELGRELGTFRLISGTASIYSCDGRFSFEAAAFQGTAIQLRVRRPKGVNFGDFIDGVIKRGELAARASSPRRASASTRSIQPL
jgi:hypothetical protein